MTEASYLRTPPLVAHTHTQHPCYSPTSISDLQGVSLFRKEGQNRPGGGCGCVYVCVSVVLNGAWSAPICPSITVSPSFRGMPAACLGDVFITL